MRIQERCQRGLPLFCALLQPVTPSVREKMKERSGPWDSELDAISEQYLDQALISANVVLAYRQAREGLLYRYVRAEPIICDPGMAGTTSQINRWRR